MKKSCFKIFLALSAVFFSQAVLAESSIFKTTGESHYENGEITVAQHGNALIMHAMLLDRGRMHAVEATLDPVGTGQYRGYGKITVRYGDGTWCRHRFGVAMTIKDHMIFLRENTPPSIPWNPAGPCIPAGPYEWFNHPEPYIEL